ncbi:MAG TPA: transcriptional regulator [Acetobacteraceae bacterium]
MTTVTIGVSSLDDVLRRTTDAFRGKPQGEHISFASVELLWKTLTPRRWALVRAMAGRGPMSIRAAGRLVSHDFKTIHGDVQALLEAGVLGKDDAGRIVFPYDTIHVDFMIEAA